jgi:hypothetical protein
MTTTVVESSPRAATPAVVTGPGGARFTTSLPGMMKLNPNIGVAALKSSVFRSLDTRGECSLA